MTNEFKETIDDLLDCAIDTFGEEVIYKPKSGGVYYTRGVFDQNYQFVDPDTEQVISGNALVLGVNLNNIKTDPESGDIVEINDQVFKVIDTQEDGQGGASLTLQRMNDDKTTNKRAYSKFA